MGKMSKRDKTKDIRLLESVRDKIIKELDVMIIHYSSKDSDLSLYTVLRNIANVSPMIASHAIYATQSEEALKQIAKHDKHAIEIHKQFLQNLPKYNIDDLGMITKVKESTP